MITFIRVYAMLLIFVNNNYLNCIIVIWTIITREFEYESYTNLLFLPMSHMRKQSYTRCIIAKLYNFVCFSRYLSHWQIRRIFKVNKFWSPYRPTTILDVTFQIINFWLNCNSFLRSPAMTPLNRNCGLPSE